MKKQFILALFIGLLSFIHVSAQEVTDVELQVTGLTCSMCSQATETSLKTLNYVSEITPDLNKNVFVLKIKKDKKVNFDQLQKKVKDAGFSVGKLEATVLFNQVKIDEEGQAVIDGTVYRFTNAKNKLLNGAHKMNVVDKNFVPTSTFKSLSETLKSDSYASGTGVVNGKKTRIFHVRI